MDTRLLRTFTTLARTGNFTSAAGELHLVQSTVTSQIQQLERELGTRLFDRLPRGAVPTEAGRRLLPRAEAVLDAEARLRAAAEPDGEVAGRVVIAAAETLVSARLPGVIAELRRSRPGVEVDLRTSGTADALDGLRSGSYDLALLMEERVPGGPDDLAVRVLGRERLELVGAPDHPLAGRKRAVPWQRLVHEEFFVHEEGCAYSDALVARLRAAARAEGVAEPRLTRFGSIEAARACVAAGLGLSLLARVSVAAAIEAGGLRAIPCPEFPDVPVLLARARARWESPAVRVVTEALAHTW
ncbi:LysR family transcriptional regulator [Phaeacidiphilus oryzae]|uniref:LysR family transcriptional regulator n=1 Tax=Phaeacidiphilus oryzae TaxID=348818 RepID=UPI0005648D46|nr:LysR family transcriptional regulator [Phaeacidiphilus oryzae]